MRFFKILFLVLTLFGGGLATSVQATTYEEGTHYEKRSEIKSKTPEIREFYSYWCGHCFSMQDMFHRIADKFKDKAKFVRNPVDLMGGAMGPESQKALAVATLIGIDEEFSNTLFKSMHQEGKIPHSINDFVYIFEQLGIPEDKFNRDYISFPVQGMVASWNKATEDLNIDAVPEIVVNGKYVVNMSAVNNEEELINVIDYVLTLD